MELVIRERLRDIEGVRAIYLCHGLAAGELYPGLSDFDLAVVFDDPNPIEFYDRFRRRWGTLKRYLPVADLSLMTVAEFETWQRIGGGWDPLDEVRHWRLLEGTELRHQDAHLDADAASMDRMQWALGHFQNLIGVAIKEEPKSLLMAIIARRQLHKCFWNAILAMHQKYMRIAGHRPRVTAWIADHGKSDTVNALQKMYDARFAAGPVTTLRVDVTALAWRLLDEALAAEPLVQQPLPLPVLTGNPVPIVNAAQVEERMTAYRDSLLEMISDETESIIVSSTGTVRGYALYIVLRDGLTPDQIASVLRDIRAVHRVFDDPWFNEHFPLGVPIVCSRNMFFARIQTGRSSLHYFHFLRRVLHGRDLYAEARDKSGNAVDRHDRDWERERLIYSLSLHQIYLARLKPALHDYVTFYYPRLSLQRETDTAPATAEEAVVEFAGDAPARMLAEYRGKDLDLLLRTMPIDEFARAWPMLSSVP
jgi:Nucleotidyltransferase domain.